MSRCALPAAHRRTRMLGRARNHRFGDMVRILAVDGIGLAVVVGVGVGVLRSIPGVTYLYWR